MNQNEDQSKEAAAVDVLKEVNEKALNSSADADQNVTGDDQPSAEEAAEQVKGSDADVDQSLNDGDQPSAADTKEEFKGSDADADRSDD
jgi:hypothetical protein